MYSRGGVKKTRKPLKSFLKEGETLQKGIAPRDTLSQTKLSPKERTQKKVNSGGKKEKPPRNNGGKGRWTSREKVRQLSWIKRHNSPGPSWDPPGGGNRCRQATKEITRKNSKPHGKGA